MTRSTLAAALALSLTTASAQAAIDSGVATSSGHVFSQIDPPAQVGDDNQNLNSTLLAFDEQQNVVLTDPLNLNLTPAGPAATLPVGTLVSSHYVFIDPAGTQRIIGTVTFDQPILGVIFEDADLDASALALGAIGTSYNSPNLLGLESGDIVTLPAANTVGINFNASSPGDYVRVITRGVPEPATASLLALGFLALRRR